MKKLYVVIGPYKAVAIDVSNSTHLPFYGDLKLIGYCRKGYKMLVIHINMSLAQIFGHSSTGFT